MVFSSLTFLFYFLPLVILFNKILATKYRNFSLLIFSLLFYIWGEGEMVLVMLISIIVNYKTGQLIYNNHKNKKSFTYLSIGVILNLSGLLYFKYTNFIAHELGITIGNIHLPIGISFFTFQGLSYLVDVYRKPNLYQSSFVKLGLYISLFPQLIAGPIVRYADVEKEINQRKETQKLFFSGVLRFVTGLFKKVVIANQLALVADDVFSTPFSNLPTSLAWTGLICYSLQIYFDFSGYSDMAIGLGRMLGFSFLENFNYPYIAKSIQDFWRRWHISLSSWFKDYLYIPLGGNRRSAAKTYLNLFIVFFATGLWHGASWNFIFWGLWHGAALILEKIGFSKTLEKSPIFIRHLYTLFVILVGWVFFRVETLENGFEYISVLFGLSSDSSNYIAATFINYKTGFILLIALFFSTPIKKTLQKFIGNSGISDAIRILLVVIGLYLSVIELSSNSYNPFIYFRF